MKVGILTHPVHDNYGGALQAFALYTVLESNGYDPILLQREFHSEQTFSLLKRIKFEIIRLLYLLGIYKNTKRLTSSQQAIVCKNFSSFLAIRIPNRTPWLHSTRALKKSCHEYGIEAIIVGSDQVWRPCYTPHIYNYYLDFCQDMVNMKRISYAASFGVDYWEYDSKMTERCRNLIKYFDKVSVREKSGISLCKKYLGRNDAVWVADPTLLLGMEDYKKLMSFDSNLQKKKNLFCYLLDDNEKKQEFIHKVNEQGEFNVVSINTKVSLKTTMSDEVLKSMAYPKIEEWLRNFYDSSFIVTDSFHGTVFSIIFNKPFVVFANTKRGNSRIESLLSRLGLEGRLVSDNNYMFIDTHIDWQDVNRRLEDWKKESLDYLLSSL